MQAGATTTISVTFRNTGTSTWTQAGEYKLGSANPQDNNTWTLGRIYMAANDVIAPGQQKTFTFPITAPATAGTYNLQFRMLHENVNWFGPNSTNVPVTVTGSAQRASAFVSRTAPVTIVTGFTQPVTVTMRNTGTATWTAAGNYRLGSTNPMDNNFWGISRVLLSGSDQIGNGQQKTFTFNITAPATPGTYHFQWQMLQEGVTWFGPPSNDLIIVVSKPGSNCPAIHPFDSQPDDAGLQCLLNAGGTIKLAPGLPGYFLAQGLNLVQNGTKLTSSNPPEKASLIASVNLANAMLRVQSKNNFTLEHLLLDGNKYGRKGGVVSCNGFRLAGTNLSIESTGVPPTGFTVRNIESNRTLCGTAVGIYGDTFEMANNTLLDNGYSDRRPNENDPWADGITAANCTNGWIHHNIVQDATDVALLSGGGPNCIMENNTLRQVSAHAFAGLSVLYFNEGAGVHTGSIFQNNTITSGTNLLDFGITAGGHPWDPTLPTTGGTIRFNSASGARVNLLVDGFANGTVDNNTLSSPLGSLNGCPAINYAAAHVTNSCLQCGWVVKSYHGFNCQNTGETIQSTCHVCP